MHTTPVSLLQQLRGPAKPEVWRRFVYLYEPLIYRWAGQLGLQDADRADLVQEAQYWDLEKNVPIGSFRISPLTAHSNLRLITADPDLKWLAVSTSDREAENSKVVVWDVKELKPLCDFAQDQVPGGSMTFSPTGDELMLAGKGYNSDGSHRERSGPDPYDIYNANVIFDWKRGVMLRTIAFPWPATLN
jgi:hypothetical protein